MRKNDFIHYSQFKETSIKHDSIFIKTSFSIKDLSDSSIINKNETFLQPTFDIIRKSFLSLKVGGLLFVYGTPKHLPFYAKYLNDFSDQRDKYLFKYWIALEFSPMQVHQPLPHSHIGLLMYLKTKKGKSSSPFKLNTKEYRIPHSNCASCGKNIKDWGGRKHLMNPLGTSFSDVWSDLKLSEKDLHNPIEIINRVYKLTLTNGDNMLVIKEDKNPISTFKTNYRSRIDKIENKGFHYLDKVINEDCISFMQRLKIEYPDGIFDLAFADPPYNLEKTYSHYDDTKKEDEYIKWCDKWLRGMFEVLNPGGSLLVLNIPKWAVYHFISLSSKMHFRNWVVWDALSTPSGKLLPAHYSLLHFTKPLKNGEVKYIFNERYIDKRDYCLRQNCIKSRKINGDDEKQILNDIWKDVHRIKHKKERDCHPCQLPIKLMNRIIDLYSYEGDLIFDPFGGAGTTAISAKLKNRFFTITDVDSRYNSISLSNLEKIKHSNNGELLFEREGVKRPKDHLIPQNVMEKKYLEICIKRNRSIDMTNLKSIDLELYQSIINDYPKGFKFLRKIANRQLENQSFIHQKDF
ncbi:MAG: site-specific DNA-methyltransferase [Flavobacteriaceae bacterium]|nr:site-specific DNA-methyltransferase [Flavobacteriaceae bacterium]